MALYDEMKMLRFDLEWIDDDFKFYHDKIKNEGNEMDISEWEVHQESVMPLLEKRLKIYHQVTQCQTPIETANERAAQMEFSMSYHLTMMSIEENLKRLEAEEVKKILNKAAMKINENVIDLQSTQFFFEKLAGEKVVELSAMTQSPSQAVSIEEHEGNENAPSEDRIEELKVNDQKKNVRMK